MKKLFYLLTAIIVVSLSSCSSDVYNIPSGYVGRILTPTGFQKDIKEAGQVELGIIDNSGKGNSLVLLEATTITVKESFAKSSASEDHRIKLKDGYAIADIYVRFNLPTDPSLRESAFTCVTATPLKDSKRVSEIKLEEIYAKFAQMNVRGKVREIFKGYKNPDEVLANMEKINAEISKVVLQVIKESKAPIELASAQLSNIKEDETIVESKNNVESASNEVMTINKISSALSSNYIEYYKWQTIKEIAKNPNVTLIIDASGKGSVMVGSKK